MKILFVADLHLDLLPRHEGMLLEIVEQERPAWVVFGGDLATAATFARIVDPLQRALRERGASLAMVLGNHDFWVDAAEAHDHGSLRSIFEKMHQPFADRVHFLDARNLDLGSHIVVGAYGHYDLSFAAPDLCIDGTPLTEEHYLRGGVDRVVWTDFRTIPFLTA